MGQKVSQLCLPQSRRKQVCQISHDLCHQGYKKTKEKVRLSFYWPQMSRDIKDYVTTCKECQLKARALVTDRTPITVIPRDPIPFNHLYMDVIGPLFDKAEWNYCLVVTDSCTRFPFAFPLRNLTAKAVCDSLTQVFTLVGVSSVVSSDQGSNFTAQCTQEFLRRLGCTPRFATPLNPRAMGLVERLNGNIKKLLHHVIAKMPNAKMWYKSLPFVLWAIRETRNDTLGVSPYLMTFGRLPNGTLRILKENWVGSGSTPEVDLNRTTAEYLSDLAKNLQIIHDYADQHADHEQHRCVDIYNKHAKEKEFQVGEQVIVLLPDSSSKVMSKWLGPGVVLQKRKPQSYLVELERGQKRWLHASKLRRYHVRVNQALVNNCSIIYEADEEFGTIPVVTTETQLDVDFPSARVNPEKLAHLSAEQRAQLLALLDEFKEVFSDKPGLCNVGEHEINVTDDFVPKRLKAYRIPELLKPEVARQIQQLLDWGFIRPSSSSMASPVVVVLKGRHGQNGVRICVDYKYLNKYTKGDAYPTTDITDIVHRVGKSHYISTYDAKSGYYQLRIKPEHIWLTAFVTDWGLFEWVRMPFGLKCSSNSYIRCVQQILQQLREFCDSYVDDMATFSDDFSSHLRHGRVFLTEIQKSGMTLNLAKCDFAKPELTFVGCVIGSGRHGPDPEKVSVVSSMKRPTTKKEVRQMLGFFSYFRTYIQDFALIAYPLTELTKKHQPNVVVWQDVHDNAFETLKRSLTETVKLHTVEYGKPFGLLVDASNFAVGCCCIQWAPDGVEKPIAFASAKLTATQKNWATIEKEAYAVIYALRKFRNFVFAAPIIVYSDHNPIIYINDCAPKSAKLTR